MRLHEIYDVLAERLSMSHIGDEAFKELQDKLPDMIDDWYTSQAKHLPFYVYKTDQDAQITSEQRAAWRGTFTSYMTGMMQKLLLPIAQKHVGNSSRYANLDLEVTFGALKGNNGEYDPNNHRITLNIKLVEAAVVRIMDQMETSFFDNTYDVYPFMDGRDYHFTDMLREVCRVFTHELVHAAQDVRIDPEKTNTYDYYSYVERDKQKFYKMIRKEIKWNHQVYLGSPQEIDAIAHDWVYKELAGYMDDGLETSYAILDDIIKDFNTTAQYTSYDHMKDSDNPAVIKARRRWLKKVYLELVARRDAVKKQMDSEAAQAKAHKQDEDGYYQDAA